MLGGRKTAADDGIKLASRDTLYSRMCAFPEGAFFTQQDIVHDPDEAADFAALREYDYVHVLDGLFTRIVETKFVRIVPSVEKILKSYQSLKQVCLVETGDRTAWKNGLKQWEPIEGYRYYSSGGNDLLSLGMIKIKIIAAPQWMLSDAPEASLFRCFYDQPMKDALASLKRSGQEASSVTRTDLEAAAKFGLSVSEDDIPDGWASPSDVAKLIAQHLNQDEK
jgi:hypothetical protein